MISVGRYTGTITENTVKATPKGSPYVNLIVEITGDLIDCPIWLTDKMIHSGKAQKQLQFCGFDYESQDMLLLQEKPKLLAGRKIPVGISEDTYNGQTRLQCQIVMDSVNKDQLAKIQDALRKKKPVEDPIDDNDIPF